DVILPKAIPGQITELRARGIDSEGNMGMILTINCKRIAPTRPTNPAITGYSQDFTYTFYGNANLQHQLAANEWTDVSGSNPTIELNAQRVMLRFTQAYANRYVQDTSGAIDEAAEAKLEYVINQQSTPTDDLRFEEGFVYISNKNFCAEQNHWLAIGYQIPDANNTSTTTLNNGHALFANNSNECYLHLRAVKGTAGEEDYLTSDIVTVKLVRKAPGAPELKLNVDGGAKGTWNDRGGVASLSYMGNSSIVVSQSSPAYSIEYCFVAAEDGKPWPGSDPGNAPFTALQEQTSIIDLGNGGANTGKAGRLYVRQNDKAHNLAGECAMLDVEPIYVDDYKLNDLNARPAQQALVRLTQDDAYGMKVMGVYETDAAAVNGKKTYYVYLMDQWGNPIKLVVNAQSMPKILEEYADTEGGTKIRLIKGDVIGRIYYHSITGEGNKMPEIWVTPGSEDYTDYLPASEAAEGWSTSGKIPADILEQPTVGIDNFNRKM
ncbi:MAG: hypothetical protein K2L66_06620, partial [Paramuribaculum sp.]|nr:hypothetical protein [Paramuribaculum sp.]